MMRRIIGLVVGFGVVVSASMWMTAQSGPSVLEGAWIVQDVSFAKPTTFPVTEPNGLIMFSGRHYSELIVFDASRPDMEQGAGSASADLLRAVWGPLRADGGTFVISGRTVTFRPTVAKNGFLMAAGFFIEQTFTLDGDSLVLARTRTPAGPVANPETIRLTRVQ